MENTLVKIDPKEFGLEAKTGKTISEAFSPKIIEREQLTVIYEEIIKGELSLVLSEQAGDLRKQLVKVRTGIASVHKVQKSFSLAYGKFCDAWKNQETLPITQMEEKLSEIEKYAENLERKRLEELQEKRALLISKYLDSEHIDSDLYIMNDMVWDAYLQGTKLNYDNKIEAEKQAELKRIAEEKAEKLYYERLNLIAPYKDFAVKFELLKSTSMEDFNQHLSILHAEKEKYDRKQEAIRQDNERLQKEAKEKERLAKIEQEKRDKELKERIEKEDKKRKELEQLAQKEAAELNAKIEKERLAKEKLEAEIKAKKDKELKEAKEKESKEKALLLAPDKDKLLKLSIDLLSYPLPQLKSKEGKDVLNDVKVLIDKISTHIKTKSENM